MTREDWECSFGLWQAQNRGSTLIGKAILDPYRLIRRHPARSHGPTRDPSNGNCGSRSFPRDNRSSCLQLTYLALSASRSPNLRAGVRLDNDATDKGGIGAIRVRRLQLADSPTLLLQRCNHRPGSILSNYTAGIPCDYLAFRAYRPSDRSGPRGRLVLFTTKSSQVTILLVR